MVKQIIDIEEKEIKHFVKKKKFQLFNRAPWDTIFFIFYFYFFSCKNIYYFFNIYEKCLLYPFKIFLLTIHWCCQETIFHCKSISKSFIRPRFFTHPLATQLCPNIFKDKKKKKKLHVTCNRWQVTRDRWHVTRDIGHIVWDEHSLKIWDP